MKRCVQKALSLLLCLVMVLSMLPPIEAGAVDLDLVTPINTREEFLSIMEHPDASYRLESNINLGTIAPLGYDPETGKITDFSGYLDGNGHTVTYSLEQVPGCYSYGLFSSLISAEILNLTLQVNCDISVNDQGTYYIGALAGSISYDSSVAVVTLGGSMTIDSSDAANLNIGGLAGEGGPGVLYAVSSSMETNVSGTDANTGRIEYMALCGGNAIECDVEGRVRLSGNVNKVLVFEEATSSSASLDVDVYTSGGFGYRGCGGGTNNYISGDLSINVMNSSISVYGLEDTSNSTFAGKITCFVNSGGYAFYGARSCSNVSVEANFTVMGQCVKLGYIESKTSKASGLYDCTDSKMEGAITVNTTDAEETWTYLYGMNECSRCSFFGSIDANTGARLQVAGAYEGSDCVVNASLSATGSGNTYCYGLYKITRGSFDGNAYASNDAGASLNATAFGASNGTHNVVTADVEAKYSAHGVSGSDCSFQGTVKSDHYAVGIAGANTIGSGVVYGDGASAISSGDHSYFSGSIYGKSGARAFSSSSTTASAVEGSVTADGTTSSGVDTSGGYFKGSASASTDTGGVGIYGESGSIAHRASGFSSTLTELVDKYDDYYIYWHNYPGCTYNCKDEFIYEAGYWGNHYERIASYGYMPNKYETLDDIDWSNSSIDPYEKALEPDLEPTSYTIRLVDMSEQPVAGAQLRFNGTAYVTDADGCITVENGPAILSPLEIQLKNSSGAYETVVKRTAFYPIPDAVNELMLQPQLEVDLTSLGAPDAEQKTGVAEGLSIEIGNRSFDIVRLAVDFNLSRVWKNIKYDVTLSEDADGRIHAVLTVGLDIGEQQKKWVDKDEYDKVKHLFKVNYKDVFSTYAAQSEQYKVKVMGTEWFVTPACYFDVTYDYKDGWQLYDTGFALRSGTESRIIMPATIYFVPAYFTAALKTKFDATGSLTQMMSAIKDLSLQTVSTLNPNIRLEGAAGIGNRSARIYGEIGIGGELDAVFELPYYGADESITIDGVLDAFGEVRFLDFSIPITLVSYETQFWPKESASLASLFSAAVSGGEFTHLPRAYADHLVSLQADSAQTYMGLDGETSYPYSTVSLLPLSDGRYLLLYTDDDLTRDNADRSALRACIGTEVDGQLVWGEAVTIENDGTGDYAYHAAVSGTNVALVWQDADQSFGNGADLQPADMASHIALSQTILDCSGETPVTGEIAVVADQGSYPYNVVLSYDGTTVQTAWTTTSNPDPSTYAEDETETIWLSDSFGAAGSAAAETQDQISGVALAADSLLWVTGQDEDMTLWNRSSDGTVSAVDSGTILNLQSNGSQFCYTKDNILYRSESGWDAVYQADSGDGYSNILRLGADGQIYAGQPGTSSSRICVVEDGKALPVGEYAGYLSSWDAANGHIVAVMRAGFSDTDSASFVSVPQQQLEDMEISEVRFDNTSVSPGSQVEMVTSVFNDGYNSITALPVTVTAADGTVLLDESIACAVAPGERQDVTFAFTLPDGFTAQNVTITIGGQAQTVTLGGTNLAVEANWEVYRAKGVSVEVRNTGLGSAGGVVTLTDERGTILGRQSVAVGEAQTETIWFEFDDYYTEDTVLTVTLTGTANEITQSDNTSTVGVKPELAKMLRVSSSVAVEVGKTSQIAIRAIPSGSLMPVLGYTSSDESIVQVDNNGTVYGVAEGEATVTVIAEDGKEYTVTVTVGPATEAPEAYAITGYDPSSFTARVDVKAAGSYAVIFADYDGGMLTNVDVVSFTSDGAAAIAVTQERTTFTLDAGDKIFLVEDPSMNPLCEAYVVNS